MTSALSPTIGRLKTGALVAASPALRAWITRCDHARRLAAIRRLVPGNVLQVPEEIVGFAELAAAHKPKSICEIGTYNGGTSLVLCAVSPSVQSFVGIDVKPFNGRVITALAPRHVNVAILQGSSRDPAIKRRVGDVLDGQPLDLLFIDGDHRYEGVRADLLEFGRLVRPGGLIAFHDIVADGGKRSGRPGRGCSGGVPRLWQEIHIHFRHWEFVRDWDQDGFGIGVIEHDPAVAI